MNTKKKIASVSLLIITLIGVSLFCAGLALCVGEALPVWQTCAISDAIVWVYVGMAAGYVGFILFFLFGMNRLCCLVWVENGILQRRGLFFGYRRTCPVENIQTIRSVWQYGGGRYLFLMDGEAGICKHGDKKCYICLTDTPANRRFILSFCRKMIQEK